MAERYTRAFGLDLIPIVARVTSDKKVPWYTTQSDWAQRTDEEKRSTGLALNSCMLILCVDSAKARKEIVARMAEDIANHGEGSRPSLIIDAGNEDNFGQVSFCNTVTASDHEIGVDGMPWGFILPKMNPTTVNVGVVPFPYSYYMELGESAAERSCADLNQTLAINAVMATFIMGVVQNVMYFKPMNYTMMKFGLDGGLTSEPYNYHNMASRTVSDSKFMDTIPHRMFPSSQDAALQSGSLRTYLSTQTKALKGMGLVLNKDGSVTAPPPKVVAPPPLEEVKKAKPLPDDSAPVKVAKVPRVRASNRRPTGGVAVPAPAQEAMLPLIADPFTEEAEDEDELEQS